MKRREFVAMTGAGLAGAFLPPLPRLQRERFVERWSWAMGQAVHVMVFAASEDQGLDACAQALAELRRVEARLSLFDDASDLCELNRHAGRGSMRADHDLRDVLAATARFQVRTAGAFNAAVEPLMRMWGFRGQRVVAWPDRVVFEEAVEAVATAVVRMSGDVVSLPNAHTQLDFGGIAVGYGIDRAIGVLRAVGIRRGFVDVSGDCYGLGRGFVDVSGDCYGLGAPPGEPEGWVVQIAGSGREVQLRDSALATSAETKSVVRVGHLGTIGHIMNPANGFPLDTDQQVTVVAPTAIAADALSTGALVRGEAPGGGARAIFTPE